MPKKEIPAIIVHQWLSDWEDITWDEEAYQGKPEDHFYVFSISAKDLKGLSGVRRRPNTDGHGRESDQNIQRAHNPQRSKEINTFVKYGFPLSAISEGQRNRTENLTLRKPGWLPTAIVVNILKEGDSRNKKEINSIDLIKVSTEGSGAKITLPENFSGINWKPQQGSLRPIEIIDGQHRLWAFENENNSDLDQYELPVVAFHGLDISWQAYLFWMINIKPKKINTSLAFDLYPLLRKEDWLDRFSGPRVYREIRAQEIIDIVYSHEKSIWHNKIDMLGVKRTVLTSQTSWINSLLTTFIKEARGTSRNVGGLFGAPKNSDEMLIPWNLNQQAAFLIYLWNTFANAIAEFDGKWTVGLRTRNKSLFPQEQGDFAFWGKESIINSDQGIRGFHYITNDLLNLASMKEYINLYDLFTDINDLQDTENEEIQKNEEINNYLDYLKGIDSLDSFVNKLMRILSTFDWRSSNDPTLSEDEKTLKLGLRGSGGYKELRKQLLNHVIDSEDKAFIELAKLNIEILGY